MIYFLIFVLSPVGLALLVPKAPYEGVGLVSDGQWVNNRKDLVSDGDAQIAEEVDPDLELEDKEAKQLDATGNLCMAGKLVPEFYVLGAMKTSTTTLAANLFHSRALRRPHIDGKGIKELHFFDQEVTMKDKASWLRAFPKCKNKKNRREVAADFTPAYIRHGSASASLIKKFYGNDLSDHLKFVVMLRDPLSRTQSAFYHHQSKTGQMDEFTFPQFITEYLAKPDKFDRQEILLGSKYPEQLASYFHVFDSDQFWVVPFLYNINKHHGGMKLDLTETLWETLSIAKGEYSESLHKNVHEHPDIRADLKELYDPVQKHYEETVTKKLAYLLSKSRAKLYGYEGERKDVEAIRQWLIKGW